MIVGTAGHIDHGKTALVRAITGVDTDRLGEEKARGITIDLGFAYLPTSDGGIVGFVDVPGHDRFVRNMVAGATGIDFVLLVVAANDGVMPQTREHFDIVSLLGLSRGAVALTKCDLVSDAERAVATEKVRDLVADSPLADAPIFPVSAATGEGIEALRAALLTAAKTTADARDGRLFRLGVDRCFSLQGVGTVVTGAVLSGRVRVDDAVVISPAGRGARVRSIHAQGRPVREGGVGERCALNLVGDGVDVSSISRGDVVLDPAAHAPANRIDAELTLLASEPRPLAHWTPVRLHHAATDVAARIALLQDRPIAPGAPGRVQLVLDKPIAAAVGDRFIVRDTSGQRTMGGGAFIDLRGPQRRRKAPARLAQLDALAAADPAEALAMALDRPPYVVEFDGFARDRMLSPDQRARLLAQVPHVAVALSGETLLLSPTVWTQLSASAWAMVHAFHQTYPQLMGPGVARVAAALEPRLLARIGTAVVRTLVAKGRLVSEGGAVRLPGHRLALDKQDHRLWQQILPHLAGDNRFRPPQGRECAAALGARELDVRRVLKAMARQQRVVELAPDRFFLQESLREMAAIAAEVAGQSEGGAFAAAAFRDRLQNGRKVAIEILDHFDRIGLTVRSGDLRRIVPHRLETYLAAAPQAVAAGQVGEEIRSRWGVRTSNPGRAVSQS